MKRIKHLILVLMMAFVAIFAIGCGEEKAPPFEFIEEVPTEMSISKEVYFRKYLEENDDAEYKLYVTYFDTVNNKQVTEEEQSSMIFILEQETEYTFKIERKLNGKKSYLTCTINVLPDAPKFDTSVAAVAKKGAVRTFGEIFVACQCTVSPGNLEQKLKFLSYDFVSMVEGVADQTGVAIDETATVDTDFTFTNEGVYTFKVKAENVSGTAETTLTVNAFDATNAAQKVQTTYDPNTKVLTWETIENATAYRVWIDNKDYVDVTETSFSFANEETYPDNEYVLKIAPVFGDIIYKGMTVTEVLPVGRVHTPLALSKDMDIVNWNVRYFVETYTVIEGDQETVLDAKTLSYALKGSYPTDTEVKVKIYGTFDDDTVTETAEITVVTGELGNVTFKRIEAANGVASDVEWVAFDMEEASDVWFMSEFVGQNAPNYGIQVMNLTSEWDGSYSIKSNLPENKLGYEYTPGGMLLCNSSEQAWTNINLYRGYKTSGPRGTVNDGKNMGLYRYKEDVHYIQIVGYEIIKDSANKSAKLTAYLFTVAEDGTLTLVNKSSGEATWATHVLGGTYATYFGNIAVTLEKFGPESITFKYAKPAKTLNSLLYNVTKNYQYREQLITLCEATEPSAEDNFVPARVLGERYHDGRVVGGDEGGDGNEGGNEGGDVTGKKTTLNGEATFDRVQAVKGIATNVDYVKFDGFDGDVWFMTQFTGKNAPNYAVHAEDAFETWDAKVATAPGAANWNDYKYFPAGTLITNSSEKTWMNLAVFRGANTDHTAGADKRGTVGDGSKVGMYRYADNVEYIQIVGYNHTTAVISSYLFTVANGTLTLVDKVDVTVAHCNGALNGSVAVIYPNIGVTPAVTDGVYTAQGPESISFTYAQPAESLYALVNGLDNDYAYKAQVIELLEVKAPDGEEGNDPSGEVTTAALTEVTMDRVNAIAGVATNVDFVKFEGFAGDVWFLTQFKGKNAPNYAVHAEDAFATWGAKALAQPGADNWATTEHPSDGENYFNYFPGGTLIANSSERSWAGISVWRGLNTNYSYAANGKNGDRRGIIGDSAKVGFYRYNENKEYVQIIGYAHETGTISCYVYEVNADGTLTVVDKFDTVVAHCNGALKGSVAVIYPNIGVTPTVTDGVYSAQGSESITFSYAQPAETLAGLINGLANDYALKAALKADLSIA